MMAMMGYWLLGDRNNNLVLAHHHWAGNILDHHLDIVVVDVGHTVDEDEDGIVDHVQNHLGLEVRRLRRMVPRVLVVVVGQHHHRVNRCMWVEVVEHIGRIVVVDEEVVHMNHYHRCRGSLLAEEEGETCLDRMDGCWRWDAACSLVVVVGGSIDWTFWSLLFVFLLISLEKRMMSVSKVYMEGLLLCVLLIYELYMGGEEKGVLS